MNCELLKMLLSLQIANVKLCIDIWLFQGTARVNSIMSKRKKPEVSVENHKPIKKSRIQYQADINDAYLYDDYCDLDIANAANRFVIYGEDYCSKYSTDNLLSTPSAINYSSIQLISKSFSKYRGYDIALRRAIIDTIFWTCNNCNENFRVSWTGHKDGRKGHFNSIEIIKHCTNCVTHSHLRNYRKQCQVSPSNTEAFKAWCTLDKAEASKRFNSSLTDSLLAVFTAIDRSLIQSITKSFSKYTGTDIVSSFSGDVTNAKVGFVYHGPAVRTRVRLISVVVVSSNMSRNASPVLVKKYRMIHQCCIILNGVILNVPRYPRTPNLQYLHSNYCPRMILLTSMRPLHTHLHTKQR